MLILAEVATGRQPAPGSLMATFRLFAGVRSPTTLGVGATHWISSSHIYVNAPRNSICNLARWRKVRPRASMRPPSSNGEPNGTRQFF